PHGPLSAIETGRDRRRDNSRLWRTPHLGESEMTDFSQKQARALRRKLDRSHVQSREVEGRSIDYIEGWFAIAEANAIFGFGGWDRETTHCERLFERTGRDSMSCGYTARVRIRVRAGDAIILREGTGWGSATAPHLGEAHERALKAA